MYRNLFSPCLGTRWYSHSASLVKNHYQALGIAPTATQVEVKAAYYKLSKAYHPDANQGSDEAGQKFRAINSAYEVLGNVRLRKLYDKGMIHVSNAPDANTEFYDDFPAAKFYRSREMRSRPPPPTGRGPIYDYDEWTRSHYGAAFARDQEIKKRQHMRHRQSVNTQHDIKTERVLIAMGALMIMLYYFATTTPNADRVVFKRNTEK